MERKTYRFDLLELLALVMIVAGSFSVWFLYPLSSPVQGISRSPIAEAVSITGYMATPALAGAAAVVLLLLFGLYRASLWGLTCIMAYLVFAPLAVLFVNSAVVYKYLDDINQYYALVTFIRNVIGIPKSMDGFSIVEANSIQYLTDRAMLSFHIMGWGWWLTVIGCLILTTLVAKKTRTYTLGKLSGLFFGLIALMMLSGTGNLVGDFYYRQADQRMALGDHAGALHAYAKALDYDGSLENSDTFTLKVSKAYYQNQGALHPYAQLYIAVTENDTGVNVVKGELALLGHGKFDSKIGQALSRMALRKEMEIMIRQALIGYSQGSMVGAARDLKYALDLGYKGQDARFYLARILYDLHEYNDSIVLYQGLIDEINDAALKASLYNALGDVYAGSKDYTSARQAYSMAYSLNKKNNLWAIKGLSGT